jgi:BssS protein family
MAWADWVRDSLGNALAVPVVTWVVDPTPESSAVLLRLDYGLSRNGHAQETVQLILTPSQLRELVEDLSEAAKIISRTIHLRQSA